jgi:DNA topoisomerase-2
MNTEENILANKYQQKTDKAHILDNPDTYIGSVEQVDTDMWIFSEETQSIVQKNISYIPGLYKLFDEGIVNCRDHVIRMQQVLAQDKENKNNALPVTYIDVTIDEATGTITMMNDGNGIDVAMHPEYNLWIPEMIFGHLRTSTNYDKTEKKIVGGKNGFGFKLVLIWSTEGTIETVDHTRGLKYIQTFKNNLDEIGKPIITKCTGKKPYTKISFKPDYQRLGIPGLSPEMLALLKKRVYDVAAITDKTLKVKYNSVAVPIKNFQKYTDLYIGDTTTRVNESAENERWEYAVGLSPTHEFAQISFVNGIHTSKGGKHVEYILNQITRKMVEFIEKKKKVKVNPNAIKEQLFLFLRCDIENPAFDSQTKDFMNTPSSKFGSSCTVSDKFIEKLAKMGVMDAACAITEIKDTKAAKKTDGSKTKNIRGIPKLIDANWAGTEKSKECTLILCEGDSAKAGIVSGLSSEDRNTIGVYPMKGKILNVRGESIKKVMENKEICEIKKILGLETEKEYKDMEDVMKQLRYSRVVFMTDQDLDGSHIKGLGINLFESAWPSLSKIPGFIGFMNTPILKARKGNQELLFYNNGEYEQWKTANPTAGHDWKIKYYKGLGTSTGKEFREYFEKKKLVGFNHNGETSENAIDMVFNKKRADDRKTWLENYDRDLYLDTNQEKVLYEEFIHKELIHFSKYDCDRSIPNLMDGLKISLRKILYSAFKKNLQHEIKVAQFTGYVSEHSGYHHGEASLNAAIVGMAQNFVGSNNINLFLPNGQFGTRLQGGRDSASERYIFTQLNKITRTLFPETDDAILKYLDDDGLIVEPLFYAPIIPMVLVNGAKGIGTGFSTDILSYNPIDIINYLKMKILATTHNGGIVTARQEFTSTPYYEGFQGTIEKLTETKFLIKGTYEKLGPDKIRITELPVGTWTEDFKEFLEGLLDTSPDKTGKKQIPIIKDYDDMSKDTTVDFIITLQKGKLEELESTQGDYPSTNGINKAFKLTTTQSTNNMHLFDSKDKLKKYATVTDIMEDYYTTRLALYETRKKRLIENVEKIIILLSNKVRYIQEILRGTIDLRNKKREKIVEILKEKNYNILHDDEEYKYLIKMPMDSVTEENVEKLTKDYDEKKKELEEIQKTTIYQMWLQELDQLQTEYTKFREERERNNSGTLTDNKKKSNSKVIVKK